MTSTTIEQTSSQTIIPEERLVVIQRLLEVFSFVEVVPDDPQRMRFQVNIQNRREILDGILRYARHDKLGRRISVYETIQPNRSNRNEPQMYHYVILVQLPAGSNEVAIAVPQIEASDMLTYVLSVVSDGIYERIIQPLGDIRNLATKSAHHL